MAKEVEKNVAQLGPDQPEQLKNTAKDDSQTVTSESSMGMNLEGDGDSISSDD